MTEGRLVDVGDTRLFVVERGDPDAFPLVVLHGGPGLDHHMFARYLDPLTSSGRWRLVLVDERGQGCSERDVAPESLTIEQMAADVTDLAGSLALDHYAVIGHSFGAFVALQHAVDFPAAAAASVISAGVASARWLGGVEDELGRFEPLELREQVKWSWNSEASVQTEPDFAALWAAQAPFHFANPLDARIEQYLEQTSMARYSPAVLRRFAADEYGGIEVEDRLGAVPQPVLVLSGRHDRTCSIEAGADMASRLPDAQFVVFERSGHMFFVEEQGHFVDAVTAFLGEHT